MIDGQVLVTEVRTKFVGGFKSLARFVGESGLGTTNRARLGSDLLG